MKYKIKIKILQKIHQVKTTSLKGEQNLGLELELRPFFYFGCRVVLGFRLMGLDPFFLLSFNGLQLYKLK
jgi:hypothetical protein